MRLFTSEYFYESVSPQLLIIKITNLHNFEILEIVRCSVQLEASPRRQTSMSREYFVNLRNLEMTTMQ
jgi:hypothetical protein